MASNGGSRPRIPAGFAILELTIHLPFVIRISDGEYNFRAGRNSCLIRTKLIHPGSEVLPNGGLSITVTPFTGKVEIDGNGVATNGVGGSHSELTIRFFCKHCGEFEVTQRILGMARGLVNQFIEIYRLHFQDLAVRSLSECEFYGVRFGFAPRVSFFYDEGGKVTGTIGPVFGDQGLKLETFGIDKDRVDLFRRVLQSGETVPITESLLLNASHNKDSSEYRLAVIEAATALDIEIQAAARRVTSDPIKRTKIDGKTSKRLVPDFIQPNLKWDLVNDPHWKMFDTTFVLLRNKVVHDGYLPTQEEVERFLECVQPLTRLFRGIRAELPSVTLTTSMEIAPEES